VRDSEAINALERMGTYLRTLKTLQVRAATTTEEVMEDGEKVQSSSTADLLAVRPNKMRVEITNDRQPRMFYYDGSNFTLWAPRVQYFATVSAPPNINDLAKRLEDKYDIDLPFVDLFRWGTPDGNTAQITSARDIGPSNVGGVTCEQYAYRQEGLDWQLWIQDGDYPLPLKVVLTTTTDDARPQHTSLYTWNLAPSFDDAAFAFTPPKDAKKITIAQVDSARTASKKGRSQ
jgi:hypothetical protein